MMRKVDRFFRKDNGRILSINRWNENGTFLTSMEKRVRGDTGGRLSSLARLSLQMVCPHSGYFLAFLIIISLVAAGPCYPASEPGDNLPSWFPQLLGFQATAIYQNMPGFHSPYQGEKSLVFNAGAGHDVTRTYGLYLGSQVTR